MGPQTPFQKVCGFIFGTMRAYETCVRLEFFGHRVAFKTSSHKARAISRSGSPGKTPSAVAWERHVVDRTTRLARSRGGSDSARGSLRLS